MCNNKNCKCNKALRAPNNVKYAESINNYTALREAIKRRYIPRGSLNKEPKKTGFIIAQPRRVTARAASSALLDDSVAEAPLPFLSVTSSFVSFGHVVSAKSDLFIRITATALGFLPSLPSPPEM